MYIDEICKEPSTHSKALPLKGETLTTLNNMIIQQKVQNKFN